jgi:three-Cys-motif partner protein
MNGEMMGISNSDFHNEQTSSNALKSLIVSTYYAKWIEIMMYTHEKNGNQMLFGYIDLYAGAGMFKDGSYGTALSVMNKIVNSDKQLKYVKTIFNDMHKKSIQQLSGCIDDICSKHDFAHKPEFNNIIVDASLVNKIFSAINYPTLLFLDPFGFKGLSLKAIQQGIQKFGCDCFVFFNYIGIFREFHKDTSDNQLELLFGESFQSIKNQLKYLNPHEKEKLIVNSFENELKKLYTNTFVSKFRFLNKRATSSSHFLFHISKSVRGFEKFKETIKELCHDNDGFPIYEFYPKTKAFTVQHFICNQKEDLAQSLLHDFSKQRITVKNLYNQHHTKTPFVRQNYNATIQYLHKDKKIKLDDINIDGTPRGKAYCKDNVVIIFP